MNWNTPFGNPNFGKKLQPGEAQVEVDQDIQNNLDPDAEARLQAVNQLRALYGAAKQNPAPDGSATTQPTAEPGLTKLQKPRFMSAQQRQALFQGQKPLV